LWVIFVLLDPDPATQINADPEPDTDPDYNNTIGGFSPNITIPRFTTPTPWRIY
jgi:hypothetical protein